MLGPLSHGRLEAGRRCLPLGPLTPTAQIHAEAAEKMLAGIMPLRPERALAIEIGAGLLLSMAAAAAARVGPVGLSPCSSPWPGCGSPSLRRRWFGAILSSIPPDRRS
jgi:hypothetical protein